VRRSPGLEDERQIIVTLTMAGRATAEAVTANLMDSGEIDRHVRRLVWRKPIEEPRPVYDESLIALFRGNRVDAKTEDPAQHSPQDDEASWFEELDRFDSVLTHMKKELNDTSARLYPWHPDD
jgi:DNA-binding MarR family transcriptional regulator